MIKHKIFLLAFLFVSITSFSQIDNNAPVRLRVGTYNVGHFNQGIAGGLDTRGGIGKEGKQRHARFEMVAWREWIGAKASTFFVCRNGINILM